jgi:hypothetical protein
MNKLRLTVYGPEDSFNYNKAGVVMIELKIGTDLKRIYLNPEDRFTFSMPYTGELDMPIEISYLGVEGITKAKI